jgi:hypothetical protein
MAWEGVLNTFSAPAAVNLSANQFYAVSYDANAHINLANAGKNMDGILQDKPVAGAAGQFCRDGFTKAAITAGVAVTVGELLQVDAGGTLTPVTAGTAVAKALEAIAAGGTTVVYITVEILRSNVGF